MQIDPRSFSVGQTFGLFILGIWLILYTLTAGVHNDNMYATVAHAAGALYRDIHYVQAPLGYYFLRLIELISPEYKTLLFLRFTSSFLVFLSICLICRFGIDKNEARWVFIVLSAYSPHILQVSGEIGSYALPFFAFTLSFLALIRIDNTLIKAISSGILLGVAASAKLNFVIYGLPFLLFMAYPTNSDTNRVELLKSAVLFVCGMTLGSISIIYHFIDSSDIFYVHNVTFHYLTNELRDLSLFSSSKQIGKSIFTFVVKEYPFTLLSIFLVLQSGKLSIRNTNGKVVVLFVFSIISAVSPGIVFPQYLAPSALILCFGISNIFSDLDSYLKKILVICFLPLMLYGVLVYSGGSYERLQSKNSSTLFGAVSINESIRSHRQLMRFDQEDCKDVIFTFAGALAVDSGFRLSRYTEGGVFWRRLRDVAFSKMENGSLNAVDPFLFAPEEFVRLEGISFYLTGFYPDIEGELVSYIKSRGLHSKAIDTRDPGLVFWYDPRCQ